MSGPTNVAVGAEPLTFVHGTEDAREEGNRLVMLAFMSAQWSGEQPFVRSFRVEAGFEDLDAIRRILPLGAVIVRDAVSSWQRVTFASAPTGRVLVRGTGEAASILVSAATSEAADELVEEVKARCPSPPPRAGNAFVHLWSDAGGVRQIVRRELDVPTWEQICRNYPRSVARQLAELTGVRRPAGQGKLILWHGAPGTGKTTALRALIQEWSTWCDAQYVMDPDRAFTNPHYLSDLIAGPDRNGRPASLDGDGQRWRLIIAEDFDEFLRADARRSAGTALGRLLNVSDGLIGQGSNSLILLTTNEELASLHPAVIRPGRCLARIEFQPFSAEEARAWLGSAGTVGRPATLAELYERRGSVQQIGDGRVEFEPGGMYL